MYEVKVGKLMVKEVINTYNAKGDLYEFVNLEDYSYNDFSILGRELIKDVNLFIAFMDAINEDNNVEEMVLDYTKFEEASLKRVFEIVDDLTQKKGSYYFDEDTTQYKKVPKIYLGKECWSIISNCYEYSNIRNEINDNSEDFFIDLTNSLKDPKDVFNNIEELRNEIIDSMSDSSFEDIINAVSIIIRKHFKHYVYDDSKNVWVLSDSISDKVINEAYNNYIGNTLCSLKQKKIDNYKKMTDIKKLSRDYSDKELGQMAWHLIYKEANKYNTILKEDISKIEQKPELIWEGIEDDEKDFVKSYLLKNIDCSYRNSSHACEEIELSVDRILSKNLKYFYVGSGVYFNSLELGEIVIQNEVWIKTLELCKMIWYMAMKFDPIFNDIHKKVEEDDKFDFYMEAIGKSILDKSRVYKELICYMKYKNINDYSKWSFNDWLDTFSGNEDYYKDMIIKTNEMCNNFLTHMVKWNEVDFVWTLSNLNEKVEDNIEDLSLNINYNTRLKVDKVYENELGNKVFSISCIIPYVNHNYERKFADKLTYIYNYDTRRYELINEDIESFIGIEAEDLYKAVSTLCKRYIRFNINSNELNFYNSFNLSNDFSI